jgi:cytochrome c-type biogenesis protein CcmF
MFPTLSEAVRGDRLTVGPSFFNTWMLPVGLILLLLTGIGPLLAWRRSTLTNLRDQFLWPTTAAVVTAVALAALGVRVWSSGLCFAFCAFVVGTIVQEFWRGSNVRRRATGTDIFTAVVGLVARNKRRYGGYIVHVGIVLAFLGFAGNGFKQDTQVLLKKGEQATLGPFTLRNDGVRVSDDGQKQMITAYVPIFERGRQVDTLYPAKWFFRKHEDEPATQVAIRRTPSEDLYVVLPAFDLQNQSTSLQIVINPLVNWIWVGFGVMAIGTFIALAPEATYAFAIAKVSPQAATSTVALLLMLLLAAPVRAQHTQSADIDPHAPRNATERSLGRKLVCMCGSQGCGKEAVGTCTCGFAAQMRGEIARMVDEGKTEEQIVQYYIDKYGSQEPLAMPLNKGFYRLSWLFPFTVGALGAVVAGSIAVRWSRRRSAASEPPPPVEPDLNDRLDDELRSLD